MKFKFKFFFERKKTNKIKLIYLVPYYGGILVLLGIYFLLWTKQFVLLGYKINAHKYLVSINSSLKKTIVHLFSVHLLSS